MPYQPSSPKRQPSKWKGTGIPGLLCLQPLETLELLWLYRSTMLVLTCMIFFFFFFFSKQRQTWIGIGVQETLGRVPFIKFWKGYYLQLFWFILVFFCNKIYGINLYNGSSFFFWAGGFQNYETNSFSFSLQEKEMALNMTVDVFCRLVKQHSNVAQLITMYEDNPPFLPCLNFQIFIQFTWFKDSLLVVILNSICVSYFPFSKVLFHSPSLKSEKDTFPFNSF